MSHGHAPSSMVPRLSRSSLVGREREISAATGALDAGHRVLSFVGAPGIGKTRVMERLAHELRGRRPTLWVDLGEAVTSDDMVAEVAGALGISLAATSKTDAPDAVARALVRAPVVLCLDNLEQLLVPRGRAAEDPATIEILSLWLDAAPITLLATSRLRLKLVGEHAIEIGPLSIAAAIALFEERALAVGSRHHEPSGTDRALALPEMEQICRRLGMNPLAIEMAAARVGILGISGLCERLAGSVDVLGHDANDRVKRHASVAAAFDWSWALLSDAERRALAHLSVFRGGFTLDLVERVVAVAGRAPVDMLEALRNHSLVDVEHLERGVRFTLSPLVRDLIAARADAQEILGARARHALAFAQRDSIDPVDVHNVEAALDAASEPALVARLANALVPHLPRCGARDRHEHVLGRGIDAARSAGLSNLEFDLLQARATLASAAGEVRRALTCQERALVLATEARDDERRAFSLARLGSDLWELGRADEGLAHIRTAVALAQEAGSPPREAYARNRLGHALLAEGAAPAALEELARAAALAAEGTDLWLRQKTLVELVAAQRRLGLVEGAARRLVELDAIIEDRTDAIGAMALRERGGLLRAQGRLVDADAALADATALADSIGAPRLAAEVRTQRALVALDRGDVARGIALADDALALAVRVDARAYRAAALCVIASARALDGDRAAALAALDRVDAALAPKGGARDAITRARALCERALLDAAADEDGALDTGEDDTLDGTATETTPSMGEALAVSRALGGSPHAFALAVAVAVGDPSVEDSAAAADRLLARTADEEARAVLLAARGAHAPAFSLSRRIERLRAGRCAREILVAADGRYFEVDGKRTSLQRQRCLRQIFLALVEHAERAPGLGLSQTEVLARGWPGERMRADSGAMRVYTSIRRLRKSGLSGVLITRDDGYLLDPTVAIRRVTARAAQ